MKENNVSRREFLALAGLTLVNSVCVYNNINTNNKNIYNLSDHVHLAEYTADTEKGKVAVKGMGFIMDGKYITSNHIPDALKLETRNTPFGLMQSLREIENEEAYLGNIRLTELVRDAETDIAIYDAYGYLPDFPCNPCEEIKLGDKVYIIGNPHLRGNNIREARISDLDGVIDVNASNHCFGIDNPLIPGDSGTPTINEDYKLIGINTLTMFGHLGYVTKISEVLKKL